MTYRISPDTQGLIFDFDGTVVDSMPIHYLSWREAFARHGADFSEAFFYEHAGVTLLEVVRIYNRTFGTSLAPEIVVAHKDAAHRGHMHDTQVIPQVMEIIKRYHGVVPMAIATGNSRNLTEPLLRELNLEKYFEAVVYGDDVSRPKPDPECFLRAASLLNVSASRCEVFEDGDAGLTGARRAGMKAIDVRPWLIQRP